MILTYKYRLLTRQKDHTRLQALLEEQRDLYNAALQERREAYKKTGKSPSYYDQCKFLTECRNQIEGMHTTSMYLQRGTLRRLDKAFQSFFRRCKSGDKPGYPRFKSWNQYTTLEWAEFKGITLKGNKLKSKAFGTLRVHFHRPLPDKPNIKSCLIGRDCKDWFVCLHVEIPTSDKVTVQSQIGLDMGLQDFITTSDGQKIPSLKAARKSERQLRLAQRKLARCKRGSTRRKKVKQELNRCHNKIKNTRNTYQHQISKMLVDNYDLIAVEKLNISKMIAEKRYSRSITDESWGTFYNMLSYKAEKAGKRVVEVDPKYTSQDCSSCGCRKKLTLKDRWYNCPECGLSLDRDHNAAKNILNRAVVSPEIRNVGSYPERVSGNINL